MSVDLNDLIARLRAEVNPPGVDLYPDATDATFLLHMQNGFWETVLDGLIMGYGVDDDGLVTPASGTTDLLPELQQIVILYAGMKVVRNLLLNAKTMTKFVAGPVSAETGASANTMKEILLDMRDRKRLLLIRLSDLGQTPVYAIDAAFARDQAIFDSRFFQTDNMPWVGAGNGSVSQGRQGGHGGSYYGSW